MLGVQAPGPMLVAEAPYRGHHFLLCDFVAARFGKDFQHLNIADVAQRWPDHDLFFAHADLYLRPELYGSMDRGALWLSTNPERDQYFWSRQSPLALLEVAEMEEGRLRAPEVLAQRRKGGAMPIRRGPSPAFNRAPSDTERLASAGRRGPCFAASRASG